MQEQLWGHPALKLMCLYCVLYAYFIYSKVKTH